MSPERTSSAEIPPTGDGEEPRVLLFMQSGRDRELLLDTLGDRYRVETTTDVEALDTQFDCCVFDAGEFNRVAGTVQSRRDTAEPVFLPFVLLVGSGSAGTTSAEVWEYADDVIELPVRKAELLARISNLVERRRTAVELNERERELQQTVADLKLKERAMDAAPVGITIAEADGEDNPLLYINDQYTRVTGYDRNVLGRDCRFLQGPGTNPEHPARIREAIDAEESVSVDILNYRKNGQKFWNSLDIAPIRDDDGQVTQFVGFQTDITERKIKERRLEVLNRVLNHNLRNRMNVVEGYLALLRDEFDDPPEALGHIESAADDLMGLADAVQKIERTLDEPGETAVVDLNERLEQLRSAFEDRYPTATFELSTPDDSCEVAVTGLMTAIEEAVENAVKHNDSPEPAVHVAVTRDSEDWAHIDVTDNGSGIPSQELDVLGEGETSLQHANRLGIWLMYWVVNRAGGEFSVSAADPEGTTVRLSVPTHDL